MRLVSARLADTLQAKLLVGQGGKCGGASRLRGTFDAACSCQPHCLGAGPLLPRALFFSTASDGAESVGESSRARRERAATLERIARLSDLHSRALFQSEGKWSRLLTWLFKDEGRALADLALPELSSAAAAACAFLKSRGFTAGGTEEAARSVLLRLHVRGVAADQDGESLRLLLFLNPLLALHSQARGLESLQRRVWEPLLGGCADALRRGGLAVAGGEGVEAPEKASTDWVASLKAAHSPLSLERVADAAAAQIAISAPLLLPGLHSPPLSSDAPIARRCWEDFSLAVLCFAENSSVGERRGLADAVVADLCVAVARLLRVFFGGTREPERLHLLRRVSEQCMRRVLASDLQHPRAAPDAALAALTATAELRVFAASNGGVHEVAEWGLWRQALAALQRSAAAAVADGRLERLEPREVLGFVQKVGIATLGEEAPSRSGANRAAAVGVCVQAVRLKFYTSPSVFKALQRACALHSECGLATSPQIPQRPEETLARCACGCFRPADFFAKGEKAALRRAAALMQTDVREALSLRTGHSRAGAEGRNDKRSVLLGEDASSELRSEAEAQQQLCALMELLDTAQRTNLFAQPNSSNVSWTSGRRGRAFV